MNVKPKVSVVTITYNLIKAGREKTFIQCLESVRNQTYGNIEHLVIDGASTDGSVDLIKQYADQGWISYLSEPDSGIYDAMNKGIQKASGVYVAFLNSDDFWHDQNGVALSVEAMEREKADFSYAPSYLIENELPTQIISTNLGTFFMQMPFCHQTMFTRRQALLDLNMFDAEKYCSAGDYNLILKLCLRGGKPVCVPCNFTSYRHGGFSATDVETSRAECIDSFVQLYTPLMPDFTRQDADRMYYDHIMPEQLFYKIREKVHPYLAQKMDDAEKTKLDNGLLRVNVRLYSEPIVPQQIQPSSPQHLRTRTTFKFLGVPILRHIEYNDGFVVKVFGAPIIKGKYK